jgi:hypothetical protein
MGTAGDDAGAVEPLMKLRELWEKAKDAVSYLRPQEDCGEVFTLTSPSGEASFSICDGCGLMLAYQGEEVVGCGRVRTRGDALSLFGEAARNATGQAREDFGYLRARMEEEIL